MQIIYNGIDLATEHPNSIITTTEVVKETMLDDSHTIYTQYTLKVRIEPANPKFDN